MSERIVYNGKPVEEWYSLYCQQSVRVNRLRKALESAIESVESWGVYASEYFQKKHDLTGTVDELRKESQECATASIQMSEGQARIGNRRLWVNAVIGALQAELEVIRQDNLASRSAENIDDTKERLSCLLEGYKSKLEYRPFTVERKDA